MDSTSKLQITEHEKIMHNKLFFTLLKLSIYLKNGSLTSSLPDNEFWNLLNTIAFLVSFTEKFPSQYRNQ